MVALTLVAVSASLAAAAPSPKVDVCHFDADTGLFHLINISENAFLSHVEHGDAGLGQPVPGQEGYAFAANSCDIVPRVYTASYTLSPDRVLANGGVYINAYVANAIALDYQGSVVKTWTFGSNFLEFDFAFQNLTPGTYTVYRDSDGGSPGTWIVLGTFVASAGGTGSFAYDVTLANGAYNWGFWVNQSAPVAASVLQTDSDLSFTLP
jgi:hypothetical protein